MVGGDARTGADPDAAVDGFVREVVARLWGRGTQVEGVETVHAADTSTVIRLRLTDQPRVIIIKLAGQGSTIGTDFQRTAAVMGMARDAGVPVAPVLAVDTSCQLGPWPYLVLEHVPGLSWRRLRPLLDDEELDAAHGEIAEAVLALQSVRLDGYGELDRSGRPAGVSLLAGLHRRTERILHDRDRAAFLRLLDEHEPLFADGFSSATLSHDDLHHDNLVFTRGARTWHLAGILDWDKAWAGPADADIARMAFWDDMTGPGFWRVYRAAVPATPEVERRILIFQLLWCLEYDDGSHRHAADTADLWRRLGIDDARVAGSAS